MPRQKITAEELRSLVNYDPETGIFTWKVDRRMGRTGKGKLVAAAGKPMGDRTASHNYPQVNIRKNVYLLHRLAFLYMTGEWPKGHVDHKDGGRGNNSWENLRDVPQRVNNQNLRLARVDSNLGVQGVYFDRHGKKIKRFRSCVTVDGTVHRLGYFSTPEEAHEAYVTAKRKLHEGCTI